MATLRNTATRNGLPAQSVPDYGKQIEKANNLSKKAVSNFWQVCLDWRFNSHLAS
jgi:hypothetical protein